MTTFTLFKRFSRAGGVVAALAMGVAVTADAQVYRKLDNIVTDAGAEYSLWAYSISENHRYVAGQALSHDTGVAGVFVIDLETGAYAVDEGVNENGDDLRGVSNTGVAAGFHPYAALFSIDGVTTQLETPDNCESAARDISNDGTVVVGSYWSIDGYDPHACVWKDGKMIPLPEPATAEMGFDVRGTQAHYCNADGSVIAGVIYDNLIRFPLIVWRLQDDGTYVCDPVCKDYFGFYEEQSTKPYLLFRTTNVSDNGKYVSLNVSYDDGVTRMAGFNLETGEIRAFVPDGTGTIEAGTASQSNAVADDGTLTGAINGCACVWRPDAAEPEILSQKYPEYTDLAEYDYIGYNLLYDITPDGGLAIGMAYNQNFEEVSYIIDFTADPTGITSVATTPEGTAETARFTLGGQRIGSPVKGLNIVRKADGTVTKVIER